MLECTLNNPIRDKFLSLFENVVLGSLKPFFQLDQQVDISLYLTKAITLCHSTKLAGLKPSIVSSFTLEWLNVHDKKF